MKNVYFFSQNQTETKKPARMPVSSLIAA